MKYALPRASSPRAATVIALLAATELVAGTLALRAGLAAAGELGALAGRLNLIAGCVLVLTGLGLVRMRLWAARITAAILYAVFFIVLLAMSLWFEQHGSSWYYWCLPLLLPVLGSCVYVLRSQRAMLAKGW